MHGVGSVYVNDMPICQQGCTAILREVGREDGAETAAERRSSHRSAGP